MSGEAPNLTYTPDENFSSFDSFSFVVSDGKNQSEPATVSIEVNPVNDPPNAVEDVASTQEDKPTQIDVLANDVELDNEVLKIQSVRQGSNGSVVINPDGTLTYTPHKDFHGEDRFTYTVADAEGLMATASVKVTVTEVDDPPTITSNPVTLAMVAGMTINPSTGRIEWIPTKVQDNQTHRVEVKVVNSTDLTASATQTFSIQVKPTPSKKGTVAVRDGYDQKTKKRLSAAGTIGLVQASDDKYQDIEGGSYIAYDFSDLLIPVGAKVSSVAVCVEHYEEGLIAPGKLQWSLGTGWPDDPKVWNSANAPVREGRQKESVDTWDVTDVVDTPEKLRTLQLQIQNNDIGNQKKTRIDDIHLIIEWDWAAAPAQKPAGQQNTGLVRYGQGASAP